MNVLVTGGNGFVGRALCRRLSKDHKVFATSRTGKQVVGAFRQIVVEDLGSQTEWSEALHGMDAIVHLAGRAHLVEKSTSEIESEYQRINVEGTRALARASVDAGVRRFIYISSVKVHGDSTAPGRELIEQDDLLPGDLYAESKRDAEKALYEIAMNPAFELVVLRPPLIYGPFVKANFLSLLKLVDRGWPMPVGGVKNLRSLLYVENLVDAIARCMVHPQASGQTFLLADGALSIGDLIRKLSQGLGRPSRIVSIPEDILKLAGTLVGKSEAVRKLTSSFVVNDRLIRKVVGWIPPFSMDEGFRNTCEWYRSTF